MISLRENWKWTDSAKKRDLSIGSRPLQRVDLVLILPMKRLLLLLTRGFIE